jgi:quercetin dioxygenase-like cupin family protein
MPWKGVFNKVLFFDTVAGTTLELAKVEKGCVFPQHYHTSVQSQFLVSGRLRTGKDQIIEPGNFTIIPAGQIHGPFAAEEESITFKWFSSTPVYILTKGETFVYQQDGTMIEAGSLPGILEEARRLGSGNFISR